MKNLAKAVILSASILTAACASSYTINDAVPDRIGDWKFEIYGIDISQNETALFFDIFTNYPKEGFQVGSWMTYPGDLALDTTGGCNFNYGVSLTSHGDIVAGTLYKNVNWSISNDFAPSGGYIYNEDKIVWIKSGEVVDSASVRWVSLTPGGPDYKIEISIPKIEGYVPDFNHTFYASATCANDFVGAPEPVSTALFLLGGVTLAVRRLRKQDK